MEEVDGLAPEVSDATEFNHQIFLFNSDGCHVVCNQ